MAIRKPRRSSSTHWQRPSRGPRKCWRNRKKGIKGGPDGWYGANQPASKVFNGYSLRGAGLRIAANGTRPEQIRLRPRPLLSTRERTFNVLQPAGARTDAHRDHEGVSRSAVLLAHHHRPAVCRRHGIRRSQLASSSLTGHPRTYSGV